MDRLSPVGTRVTSPADVLRAVEMAIAFAARLGFPAQHCDETGLVVGELASSLIRRAGGTVRVGRTGAGQRAGVEIQFSGDPGQSAVGLESFPRTIAALVDELDVQSDSAGTLLCRAPLWDPTG